MKRIAWVATAAFLCALAVTARTWGDPYSIGLFSDEACTSCNLDIPQGSAGTFYVQAAAPEEGGGLLGAEFRVIGLPPEWYVVSVTPNPLIGFTMGNFLAEGVNIAFPSSPSGNCIRLFAVQVFATTAASDVTLQVTKHMSPSNPNAQCPRIVPDCGPCYTIICVGNSSMFVNSSRSCTVATIASTWSHVKSLYAE